MNKKKLLIIIPICIIVLVILFNYRIKNTLDNDFYVVETFADPNFKPDETKIILRKSTRFSKSNKPNSSRDIYGFIDVDYFNKNKTNLFNYYGINDDKIKQYYEEKYKLYSSSNNLVNGFSIEDLDKEGNDMLNDNKFGEVGIGFDKEKNIQKLYFSINKYIYSIKRDSNNNYLESLYKDNDNISKQELKKYFGEKNFNIINDNIKKLNITQNSNFNETLKGMGELSKKFNSQLDISTYQNIYNMHLKDTYRETPQSIDDLSCFTRYDNNVLAAYDFDISEKQLLVKDSKEFLSKLLSELQCNSENIDNLIKENKDYLLTNISFIVKNNEVIVTIYYDKPMI